MGEAVAGLWKRSQTVPYIGARKWGTGVNPIHEIYGEGPPISVTGRLPGPNNPTLFALGEVDPQIEASHDWGYDPGELPAGEYYAYMDEHPNWGDDPYGDRFQTDDFPSWGEQVVPKGTGFRAIAAGGPVERHTENQDPNETVSEGWLNKAHTIVNEPGTDVADSSQYERQTSMQQLHVARNNQLAQQRETDDPRSDIMSRVVGMKLKVYSTGQRLYDMEPRDQDAIPRPFVYRTIATDFPGKMAVNEAYVSEPLQRVPPADPYLGEKSTDVQPDFFGYTPEDYFA